MTTPVPRNILRIFILITTTIFAIHSYRYTMTFEDGSILYDQFSSHPPIFHSTSLLPNSRLFSTHVRKNNTHTYVMFGHGYDSFGTLGLLNDMWIFDHISMEFTFLNGLSMVNQVGEYGINYGDLSYPGSRRSSKGLNPSYYPNEIVIFGGYGWDHNGDCGYLNNIWGYHMNTNEWRHVYGHIDDDKKGKFDSKNIFNVYTKNNMGGREHFAFWINELDPQYILFFGGIGLGDDGNGFYQEDFYIIKMNLPELTDMSFNFAHGMKIDNANGVYNSNNFDSINAVGARMGHVVWASSYDNSTSYIFGGEGMGSTTGPGMLNDLWQVKIAPNHLTIEYRFVKGSQEVNDVGNIISLYEYDDNNIPKAMTHMSDFGIPRVQKHFFYGGIDGNGDTYNSLWTFDEVSENFMFAAGKTYSNPMAEYFPIGVSNETFQIGGTYGCLLFSHDEFSFYIFSGYSQFNSTYEGYGSALHRIDVIPQCGKVDFNAGNVCSGRGVCSVNESCSSCGQYVGNFCEISVCFGKQMIDFDVCSNHGDCVDTNTCFCNTGYYGSSCEIWECYDTLYNNTNVCSSNGICSIPNQCNCSNGYYGDECEYYDCFGTLFSSSQVCGSHGDCIFPNNCSCYNHYNGFDCYEWNCNDIDHISPSSCTAHGICYEHNGCNCTNGYYGQYCSFFNCTSCNYGFCNAHEDCLCFEGYFGNDCDLTTCNGLNMSDSNACSSKGTCISYNECICIENHYGNACKEMILEGTYLSRERMISIPYEVSSIDVIEGFPSYPWDCNEMIENYKILGEDAKCQFGYTKEFQMEKLNVYLTEKFTYVFGMPLFIIPVSSTSRKSILINISKHLDGPIIVPPEIDYFLYMIIFIIACCIGVLIIFVVFGIIVIFVLGGAYNTSRRNSRRLEKLVFGEEEKGGIVKEVPLLEFKKEFLIVDYSDIRLIELIAKGGSNATVYKAKWRKIIVAVKLFQCSDMSGETSFSNFEKEAAFLTSLAHPNIVTTYGYCLKPPRVGIVQEYCSNGDLRGYFYRTKAKKKEFFNYLEKLRILSEIVKVLEYLHLKDIIHRDIKCDNVLLNDSFSAKVTDFGVSKLKEQINTQRMGTSYYISPEVTLGKRYDEKCDIYSMAIVMYEVITESFNPFFTTSKTKSEFEVSNNSLAVELKVSRDPFFRPKISREFKREFPEVCSMLKEMWNHNPNLRPPAIAVLRFFKDEMCRARLRMKMGKSSYIKFIITQPDSIEEEEKEEETIETKEEDLKKKKKIQKTSFAFKVEWNKPETMEPKVDDHNGADFRNSVVVRKKKETFSFKMLKSHSIGFKSALKSNSSSLELDVDEFSNVIIDKSIPEKEEKNETENCESGFNLLEKVNENEMKKKSGALSLKLRKKEKLKSNEGDGEKKITFKIQKPLSYNSLTNH